MSSQKLLTVALDQSVVLDAVPQLPVADLRAAVLDAVAAGGRIVALFGWPDAGCVRVVAAVADPADGLARLVQTVPDGPWPALTPDCPAAEFFERELAEQTGLIVENHPWLKPVRRPLNYEFYAMAGDEVHEVAVGPVHAGVIEPGHFRFQCHGEMMLHVEIVHGYQHRGVEEDLVGGPNKRAVHVMETAVGDTTAGHTIAYCQLLESLAGVMPPARGVALRAVALELERIANHVGDLGAMSGDVGYLPSASFLGRLRGEVLNLTADMCGSRFGRGFIRPGGIAGEVDDERAAKLVQRLGEIMAEVRYVVDLMWESPSVRARFDGTGVVKTGDAAALGMVGPVARAAGRDIDARVDFPTGYYRMAQVPVASSEGGDCQARALVRWLELQRSAAFVKDVLGSLPRGEVRRASLPPLAANSIALTCTEGWRGEIWHVAVTGGEGQLARYKIVDPSFHNWNGLALALRGEAISDFPLCNKSFNLSYCGFDL